MSTSHPLPPPVREQALPLQANGAPAAVTDQALMPLPVQPSEEFLTQIAGPAARLPVELEVSVAVKEFRVRNLLALEPGQLIETQWGHGDDVPVSAGDVQLAWSEFEVVDSQMAVRVTRLA